MSRGWRTSAKNLPRTYRSAAKGSVGHLGHGRGHREQPTALGQEDQEQEVEELQDVEPLLELLGDIEILLGVVVVV